MNDAILKYVILNPILPHKWASGDLSSPALFQVLLVALLLGTVNAFPLSRPFFHAALACPPGGTPVRDIRLV